MMLRGMMAEAEPTGVIRHKLQIARDHLVATASEGGPGADRSWRIALARAAQDTLSLPLDVPRLSLHLRSLTEVTDLLPDRALLAVLEGPGECLGLLAFSPPVLAGLIEVQTMGRVLAQAPLPRKPTRTDAAMVAGVIERAMAALDESLADEADLVWAGGFRYASFLDDPRPLGLLLEDQTYRVLTAQVSLAGGAKSGEVILALPAEGRGHRPTLAATLDQDAHAVHAFSQSLCDAVLGVPCQLDAVLARVVVSLATVLAMEPGTLIPLPSASLSELRVEGMTGQAMAEARLGQNRGMRALRLGGAVAPARISQVDGVPVAHLSGLAVASG
jgi:flagellar motor switch protein FliM